MSVLNQVCGYDVANSQNSQDLNFFSLQICGANYALWKWLHFSLLYCKIFAEVSVKRGAEAISLKISKVVEREVKRDSPTRFCLSFKVGS